MIPPAQPTPYRIAPAVTPPPNAICDPFFPHFSNCEIFFTTHHQIFLFFEQHTDCHLPQPQAEVPWFILGATAYPCGRRGGGGENSLITTENICEMPSQFTLPSKQHPSSARVPGRPSCQVLLGNRDGPDTIEQTLQCRTGDRPWWLQLCHSGTTNRRRFSAKKDRP